jgi:hypothetical protein
MRKNLFVLAAFLVLSVSSCDFSFLAIGSPGGDGAQGSAAGTPAPLSDTPVLVSVTGGRRTAFTKHHIYTPNQQAMKLTGYTVRHYWQITDSVVYESQYTDTLYNIFFGLTAYSYYFGGTNGTITGVLPVPQNVSINTKYNTQEIIEHPNAYTLADTVLPLTGSGVTLPNQHYALHRSTTEALVSNAVNFSSFSNKTYPQINNTYSVLVPYDYDVTFTSGKNIYETISVKYDEITKINAVIPNEIVHQYQILNNEVNIHLKDYDHTNFFSGYVATLHLTAQSGKQHIVQVSIF